MRNIDQNGPLACILAYDGLCTFEFGICVEVFGRKRPELDVDWYRFAVIAREKGPFAMDGGLMVQASHDLEMGEEADLIIVPGWPSPDAPVDPAVIGLLQRAVARGAMVASICSGVFVLAEAGLLAGRRATTHWRYTDAFHRRFPEITLEPDVLYVDEGQVLTSAGSAAGLDLCLHIVRRRFGVEVANSVARRLVLPAHREGGQAQFVPKPVARSGGGDLSGLMDRVRRQLDQEWTVTRMAGEAGFSLRTLIRRFKDGTGQSPLAWLTAERVAYARELLETTDFNVEQIAQLSGLNTPETLRHHFRKQVGIAPLAYRAAFGSGGQPLKHRLETGADL
ncbi:transcriptional regulator FtrA [Aestuariispira insulae]|uniref:AraC family transcriptional regulator with amidase-like domain n=1 Tax=Aestuariispira insulae TaxID=1461337 RepID=A0A3D9HX76_9PROT|nr:transcriptional regulator FtrA [Aestuariispira insulae]RED53981.1 AraC family transcriptional regulator with amidase-like domain [Aestuariispira insulae]